MRGNSSAEEHQECQVNLFRLLMGRMLSRTLYRHQIRSSQDPIPRRSQARFRLCHSQPLREAYHRFVAQPKTEYVPRLPAPCGNTLISFDIQSPPMPKPPLAVLQCQDPPAVFRVFEV